MHLALFGGTGRTGRPLLDAALAAGHTVTALARSPSALPPHARLTVVEGSVTDPDAVARTVAGTDAVASTLGPSKTSPPDVMTQAAHHIVAAMQGAGVRRIVSVLGAGVADPRDPGGLGPAFMRGVMALVARRILDDARGHADVLRASGLDWTIVRPPRLTTKPATGRYATGYVAMGPGHEIPRADLAHFMLHLLASGEHVGEMPMIHTVR